LKVTKPAATSSAVGWVTDNNAQRYWNRMTDNIVYNISAWIKTEGVNTNPGTDDERVGVWYRFYDSGGNLIVEELLAADQSAATVDWHQVQSAVQIPAGSKPDSMVAEVWMGKDATGTIWVDDLGLGSDPWTAGMFGGDVETPKGWMHWTSSSEIGLAAYVDEAAHSGSWSAKLEELDDNADEMVFYSEPAPAQPGKWYMLSAWVKVDSISPTNEKWFASNVTPDRDNDRAGFTFFFHRSPLRTDWNLTGGDQFVYLDQRTKSTDGWVRYLAVAQAPEDAAGVSFRARFTSFPKGTVYYDHFEIFELDVKPNILANGDLEISEPFFWNKVNDGLGGASVEWARDAAHGGSWSLKVTKPAATSSAVGWVTDNNAQRYWNRMTDNIVYNISAWIKTEGVNTNPGTDDERVGVWYRFYDSGGNLIVEELLAADQSAATVDWHQVQSAVQIPAGSKPDSMVAEVWMGKDATGTIWVDDLGLGSDPWTAGMFGGDVETPKGWMHWTSSSEIGLAAYVDEAAHSGSWSAKLEELDDNADEMVFYSEPAPAQPGKWYMLSAWVKVDSISPTNEKWFASNVTPDRDNDRAGFTFFFHRSPLRTDWNLTGGDQFVYLDQRTKSTDGWVRYLAVAQAPEDAAGVSFRARFTSFPKGTVYYDHFEIYPVEAVVTSVDDEPTRREPGVLPVTFELEQNYPNPFNPETAIRYHLPKDAVVTLEVYNVIGQKVRTLVQGFRPAGTHKVVWDGLNDLGESMTTGIYFYKLRAGDVVLTKKMALVR
jgi:hypothetical protein